MPGLVIVCRDDLAVAHDGSEGVSPEGWLPDRVSVGALTKTFPPELVDQVVKVTDTREVRRRLLPARLVVYFVLALWLFRGRNCGYGRVLGKLVDGLYHRRRGWQLLAGQLDPAGWVDAGQGRRWRPPNISNLARARARLGADPLHMLFEQVAGPVGGSVDGSAGDPLPARPSPIVSVSRMWTPSSTICCSSVSSIRTAYPFPILTSTSTTRVTPARSRRRSSSRSDGEDLLPGPRHG